MICDVCGRHNPDDLTYCQDCGRRLKAREQRAVPPTPPTGLPRVELPATAPQPALTSQPAPAQEPATAAADPSSREPRAVSTPARSPARLRPEAPLFSFTPAAAAKAGAPPAPEPERDAADSLPVTVAVRTPCPSCEAENPPGYRFCVTCGAPLKAARTEPAAPPEASPAPSPPPGPTPGGSAGASPAPPPNRPPPPPPPAAATLRVERGDEQVYTQDAPDRAARARADVDKIVGAPVVDIAVAHLAPERTVECGRCHGHCIAGTRFCKYCGAQLEPELTTLSSSMETAGSGPKQPAASPPAPIPHAPMQETGRAVSSPAAQLSPSLSPSPSPSPPQPSPHAVRPAPLWQDAHVPRGTRAPEGKLVVIVEDGSEGKTFPLSGRQIDVGRTEGDILLEDDLYVSPRHARLIPHEGAWILRDLGSANRVYLRIRQPHPLRDGDLLLLGLEVLQFQTVSDGERGLGHAIQHGTLLFGSPAIQRRARLCQRTVEGVVRDMYHLHRDETVIGRETGDIVFTSDPFLSRRHAVIRRNQVSGEFTVTDLDSSNGTYIAIQEDISLVNGDFVRIGQHLFRVDLS